MKAWTAIDAFSSRFSLRATVATPFIRILYEPTANYTEALIGMVAELKKRDLEVQNGQEAAALEELERYTHRLTDALVLGMMGLYNAGAVVLRSGVTAVFHMFEDDPAVWRRLKPSRREGILKQNYRMNIAEIRHGLYRTRFGSRAEDLYRLYNDLSGINYGDGGYEEMEQYLRSIPRTVPDSVRRYKRDLERSAIYTGDLVLLRFQSIHGELHLQRFGAFIRALDALRLECGFALEDSPLSERQP